MGVSTASSTHTTCGVDVRANQIISILPFFNIEISCLPDRFLMEIEENVNAGTEQRQFSKIASENRKNMQSQIVVCDSRE